jgi:hypothetical protein
MDSHVNIPAHHMGFRRYVRSSDDDVPYAPFRAFASLSPWGTKIETRGYMSYESRTFLVIMKLVPIASELETARASPMYLSLTIAAGQRRI